jgi:hypothetical protein
MENQYGIYKEYPDNDCELTHVKKLMKLYSYKDTK